MLMKTLAAPERARLGMLVELAGSMVRYGISKSVVAARAGVSWVV